MHNFQQKWTPTKEDIKLEELAEKYHTLTEAYDRTVCTGPIFEGSSMPMNSRELGEINRNAREVLKDIYIEAEQVGITRQKMWYAITHYTGKR